MSRSYKKHPCCGSNTSGTKRFANQKVRNTDNIPNGKAYRKIYPSWNICEHRSISTLEEYITRNRNHRFWWWARKEQTDAELTHEWYTMYKMK